jgi:hypothetical protein
LFHVVATIVGYVFVFINRKAIAYREDSTYVVKKYNKEEVW